MKIFSLIGFSLIIILLTATSRSTAQTRYLDTVFSNIKVTNGIQFGSNKNAFGINQNLLLDIYEPEGDTSASRPLMIWVHGGAFVLGDRKYADVVLYCKEFAKRGYVTASIDYRLGVTSFNNKGYMEAILRATQDLKAAIRFFRANASVYKINTEKIIAGGTSAGGFTAIHTGYLNADEIPSEIDTSKIGSIEGNSGNPGYSSKFNLIVNCWGAIVDTNWMQAGDLPVVSIHGTADNIVPCYSGKAMGVFPVYGSGVIERNVTRLGIENKLKLFYGAGHQLIGGSMDTVNARFDTSITVISNFIYSTLINPFVSVEKQSDIPVKDFIVDQNYPNPFNPSTIISYQLLSSLNPSQGGTLVSLKVFDILGKEVATLVNEVQKAGIYNYTFSIDNYKLKSGNYFYKLTVNNFSETKKFTVLK
ncbi:MAG: carboxylesterase family protein [Ignavibacteriales bacterium]|nr:carboxylesterase family protein [Ignavibacteriales bacterium]